MRCDLWKQYRPSETVGNLLVNELVLNLSWSEGLAFRAPSTCSFCLLLICMHFPRFALFQVIALSSSLAWSIFSGSSGGRIISCFLSLLSDTSSFTVCQIFENTSATTSNTLCLHKISSDSCLSDWKHLYVAQLSIWVAQKLHDRAECIGMTLAWAWNYYIYTTYILYPIQ